jgi:hypothetical protein
MKYSHVGWAIFFLFVVYVLGFGPAIRLAVQKGQKSRTTACVDFLYAPLFWLREEVPPIRKLTGWYIDFCIYYPTDPERNGD